MFGKTIRYQISHLTDFSGRDTRQTFWYFVLVVVAAQYAITIIASIPMYVAMFTEIFSAVRNNPQSVDDTAIAMDGMFDSMMRWMNMQMVVSVVVGVISTALLAATTVRRCHDAGFTGWIAVVPIGFYLVSLGYSVVLMGQMEELMQDAMLQSADGALADPFAMQAEMGLVSLAGWIAPIVGIIIGVWPSEDGPNQYGEEPVSF